MDLRSTLLFVVNQIEGVLKKVQFKRNNKKTGVYEKTYEMEERCKSNLLAYCLYNTCDVCSDLINSTEHQVFNTNITELIDTLPSPANISK